MGLFDFMKVCLFSEVNGVVTLEGKPVAGAEIVRTAKFSDTEHTDKAVTDADGKFHFDAMYTYSINKALMIIEPVFHQKMMINYQAKEYRGWKTVKRSYDENTEVGEGKQIILTCELTDDDLKKEDGLRVPIVGICKIN
ncbi:MAG: carboxypeptidase-like regulatory domain-containing protein [Gammaproteobacteria bacterium]|nr:carboxypeptidase-like regulatory domain-containing protein [Gammaproteobacteria bacterium]